LILLDTSVLVASLAGERHGLPALRKAFARGERLLVPTIVLYEWWRGPRSDEELADQESLLPSELALPFGVPEAVAAARLYRQVRAARSREIDLAIAACAIVREIPLWTLNRDDFKDIPGLTLAKRDYTGEV
jgi:predicted nucleic acid-binding protein